MSKDSLYYVRDEDGTLLGVTKSRSEGLKRLEKAGIEGQVVPMDPEDTRLPGQGPEIPLGPPQKCRLEAKDYDVDIGTPKTVLWAGENWVPAKITSDGMAKAKHIETFYGSEAYAHKRYLGDHVNPQRIFDTFIDDDELGPISRVGFRSEDMLVGGDRVILFAEFQKSKPERPYRVGVQMNYQFSPDYFLETSNEKLALLSIITLDRVRLNFTKWLEACRYSFDFET